MQRIFFLITILLGLIPYPDLAQTGNNWKSLNDGTSSCKGIRAVWWLDANTVIAVGENFVLRSTDAGITWEEQPPPTYFGWLNDLHFTNNKTGFIAGNQGIFRTDDLGTTWTLVHSSASFLDIDFIGEKKGYALAGSSLYRSIDGGLQWAPVSLANIPTPLAIEAVSSSVLILGTSVSSAAGPQGPVYRSDTDGETWNLVFSATRPVRSFFFVNANDGFGVGDNGLLIETHNGGQTWSEKFISPAKENLRSVWFATPNTGFVAGASGLVMKTEDAGKTWTKMPTGVSTFFYDIGALDATRVLAGGPEGSLLLSTDGAQTWTPVRTGNLDFCQTFQDVFATDAEHLVVCGNNLVNYSPDGGKTWEPSALPKAYPFSTWYSVFFKEKNIGFVTGTEGIIRSKNGGLSFDSVSLNWISGTVHDLHFPPDAPDTGYAVMEGGGVLISKDGGMHWDSLAQFTYNCLLGVHFIRAHEGWVVGASGLIAHTVDYGASWDRQVWYNADSSRSDFTDVQFVNDQIGFICGDQGLLKTKDGGQTWQALNGPFCCLNSIYFSDTKNGSTVDEYGVIYRTYDGGNTWATETDWPYATKAIHFPTPNVGYVVGDRTILKSDRGLEFSVDTLSGPGSAVLELAVRTRNFENVSSFQWQIQVVGTDVQLLKAVKVALPGTFNAQPSGGGKKLNVLWSSSGNCSVSLPDGSPVFKIQIKLTGAAGTCANLVFNTPFTKANKCIGNGPSYAAVPVVTHPGLVCIFSTVSVCGHIDKASGNAFPDVAVFVETIPPTSAVLSGVTDAEGDYCVTGIAGLIDLDIVPLYDKNYGEGVSVDDWDLLKQFLAGQNTLPFSWQKVAADIDADGVLTGKDEDAVVELIFNPDDPIPGNTSWRFVPENGWPLPGSQGNNVPSFKESIYVEDIPGDMIDQDFKAIKTGDLTGDALFSLASDRKTDTFQLSAEVVRSEESNTCRYDFRAPDAGNLGSLQADFAFGPSDLDYPEILPGKLLHGNDYRLSSRSSEEGRLSLLWARHPENRGEIQPEDVLFSIRFRVAGPDYSCPELRLNTSPMPSLAFDARGHRKAIRLVQQMPPEHILLRIVPNLWSERATVICEVPSSARTATLAVTDIGGRIIHAFSLIPGERRQVELQRGDLPPGLYFALLKIDGAAGKAEKMVVYR